jgi:hypothetical protein
MATKRIKKMAPKNQMKTYNHLSSIEECDVILRRKSKLLESIGYDRLDIRTRLIESIDSILDRRLEIRGN